MDTRVGVVVVDLFGASVFIFPVFMFGVIGLDFLSRLSLSDIGFIFVVVFGVGVNVVVFVFAFVFGVGLGLYAFVSSASVITGAVDCDGVFAVVVIFVVVIDFYFLALSVSAVVGLFLVLLSVRGGVVVVDIVVVLMFCLRLSLLVSSSLSSRSCSPAFVNLKEST